MADSKKTTEPSEEKRRLRRSIARILWDVDMVDVKFSDSSARKNKFDEDRTDYLKQSAMLIGRLEKNGITIAMPSTGEAID